MTPLEACDARSPIAATSAAEPLATQVESAEGSLSPGREQLDSGTGLVPVPSGAKRAQSPQFWLALGGLVLIGVGIAIGTGVI